MKSDGPFLRHPSWSVFALALVVRLIYLMALKNDLVLSSILGLDSTVYLERSSAILAGDILGQGPLFHSGYLYPYILALAGGVGNVAQFVQAALDSTTAALISALVLPIAGPTAAIIGGVLYALSGPVVFGSGALLFDTWVSFFVVLSLWLLSRDDAGHRWFILLLAGMSLGLAATAKPFVFAALPLWFALWWWRREGTRWQKALRPLALTSLGFVLALAPFALRNAIVLGHPSPLPATGGLAFYLGNNPITDGTLVIPSHLGVKNSANHYAESSTSYPSRRLGRSLTPFEASRFWFSEGLRFWREKPTQAAKLMTRKVLLLFNRAEVSDNYDFGLYCERLWVLRYLPSSALIISLSLVGLIHGMARWRSTGHLAVTVGVYIFFLPFFWMAARFRLPMLAVMCCFAGIGVVEMWRSFNTRNWRVLLINSAVWFAGLMLAIWPIKINQAQGWRSVQLVKGHLRAGEKTEAVEILNDALQREPDAQLLLLAGQLHQSEGRTQEALQAFRKSAALAPDLIEAHRGIEEISSSIPDPHETALLAAAQEAGNDARAWLQLGKHYVTNQRLLAALDALQRAHHLRQDEDEIAFFLAVTAAMLGDAERSVTLYEDLLTRQPLNTAILCNLGFAEFDLGELEASQQTFQHALDIDHEAKLAHFGLGLVHKFRGEAVPARRHFELFLQKEPPNSLWSQRARKHLEEVALYLE